MDECPELTGASQCVPAPQKQIITNHPQDSVSYLRKNNLTPDATPSANETMVRLHAASQGKELVVVRPQQSTTDTNTKPKTTPRLKHKTSVTK
jgi:hypothetical protein